MALDGQYARDRVLDVRYSARGSGGLRLTESLLPSARSNGSVPGSAMGAGALGLRQRFGFRSSRVDVDSRGFLRANYQQSRVGHWRLDRQRRHQSHARRHRTQCQRHLHR